MRLALATALLWAIAVAPASAAFSGAFRAPDEYIFQGDAAADELVLTITGDHVEHNRFGGDAGFASAADFDSATDGEQRLTSDFARFVTVRAGAGSDSVSVTDAGGAGAAWAHAHGGTGGRGGCVAYGASTTSLVEGICYADDVEAMAIRGGGGSDSINSLDSAANAPLVLDGGGGDDQIAQYGEQPVGHAIRQPVTGIGGPGRDSVSLSDFRVPATTTTVDGGRIARTGYPPVSYDASVEEVGVLLGAGSTLTITESLPLVVRVSLNSGANTVDASGATGARLMLFGGPGVDRVVGSRGDDVIAGDQGDDAIDGGAGDDRLNGGVGRLTSTDDGNDTLIGGAGDDSVIGEGGNDVLDGGPGADALLGYAGDDTLRAFDGTADVAVNCGDGTDSAFTDSGDRMVVACETVRHESGGSTTMPGARCAVPKLRGKTLSSAKRLLKRAGCRTGSVKYPRVRKKKGYRLVVRSQSPRAGKSVDAGTKVKLTLRLARR